MEAQQSHLWSSQQPKRMAETSSESSRNTTETWHEKTAANPACSKQQQATHSSFATWTISYSWESQQWRTNCLPTHSNTFYSDQQETSQMAAQSTFLAETSPTKATTLKSAWQTATQQNCSTKQAWPTARQHRHREQRPATRIQNKHPMLRNTQHTDEQSASYSG